MFPSVQLVGCSSKKRRKERRGEETRGEERRENMGDSVGERESGESERATIKFRNVKSAFL